MGNPEKGKGIVFKNQYVAQVEWSPEKAVIRVNHSTRQAYRYLPRIEMSRPINVDELSKKFRSDGISEPETVALIAGIKQELSEI